MKEQKRVQDEQRRYKGAWRNQKAEERYRSLDAAEWERLTDSPPDAIDVATEFGSTRAYHWPGDGPTVVFLHGMGDTSIRWVPFAAALQGHNLYALDIMGDVGMSKPDIGFTDSDDYADWLHQALEALGVLDPHMVGMSLGGYLALSSSMGQPTRVASTTVFDPVGVVDLRLVRFMAWGFGAMLGSFAPASVRRRLARRVRHPMLNDKEAARPFIHGQLNHPPKLPPLPVFTDEQLGSITTPVRVLAGAKSMAFDGPKLVERINTAVPNGQAVLLPDAGHAMNDSHFDDCVAAIRSATAAESLC